MLMRQWEVRSSLLSAFTQKLTLAKGIEFKSPSTKFLNDHETPNNFLRSVRIVEMFNKNIR